MPAFLFLTPQESAADHEMAPMQAMLRGDGHLEGLMRRARGLGAIVESRDFGHAMG